MLPSFNNFATHPSRLLPDVRDPAQLIQARHGLEEWKAAVLTSELHRHLGTYSIVGAKMGLRDWRDGDGQLVNDLLSAMQTGQADFTNTFAGLADGAAEEAFAEPAPFAPWFARYTDRLAAQGGADIPAMARANPRVIPRNHRVEAMINAAVAGDFAPFRRLLDTATRPFDTPPPELTLPPEPDEEVLQTFCGT